MMMNKVFSKLLLISALAWCMASCNDFDTMGLPYDTDRDEAFIPNPPEIDPDWKLVLIDNIGQHGKNVYVYKDKKYDSLFTRTLGWNGGDGVLTTELPDGNLFWSFNDSWFGEVDGATRTRLHSNFPRNSIMVQKGNSSGLDETPEGQVWLSRYYNTTDPNAPRYYEAFTHLRNPDAKFTQAELEAGQMDNDYVYWAGDGTIYDDPVHGKTLQLLWMAVDLTQGEGIMLNYNKALVKYSLQGTPGDGTYMSIISEDHYFHEDALAYGSTMCEGEDGLIYLYCTEQSGANCQTLVARTTNGDLGSEWEYYVRDLDGEYKWVSEYPDRNARSRSYIQTEPGSMPWVFKHGDYYYMTFQTFPFGRSIQICRSENPWGPFVEHKVLFTLPATLDKIGYPYPYRWYMVNLHTGLSRNGELVFSTNSDPVDFRDHFTYPGSADFYRPYFFRVFNWETLFQDEEDEETIG